MKFHIPINFIPKNEDGLFGFVKLLINPLYYVFCPTNKIKYLRIYFMQHKFSHPTNIASTNRRLMLCMNEICDI